MDGHWWDLALITALIVLNALFAGTEIALVSLRESQLRRLRRRRGAAAARLVRLTGDPNRYLATIQIGITLAGFLASATAAVSLAEPLVPLLGFAGQAAAPLAVALVTALLAFVTLVVGELAPKRLAMQFPQRWSLLAATPLNALASGSGTSRVAVAVCRECGVGLCAGHLHVERNEMLRPAGLGKGFRHPVVGDFDLAYETLALPGGEYRSLVVFTAPEPRPDTALRLLGSWEASAAPAGGTVSPHSP
ncbi:CNNM domain-containing protein [Streptomyces yangpuensis]|uniref:CNNM domain-containing protein n=1 Tax=Streptomyces yangpuensis TaxID=1648182 RepID=UPI0037159579